MLRTADSMSCIDLIEAKAHHHCPVSIYVADAHVQHVADLYLPPVFCFNKSSELCHYKSRNLYPLNKISYFQQFVKVAEMGWLNGSASQMVPKVRVS